MKTEEEIKEAAMKALFPEKEQRVSMFMYVAFMELLKSQKDTIKSKIAWEAYINTYKQQIIRDLEELI